jgi:ribosome biogenesis GTPase / thiamine phosphate phosphatase
MLARGKILRIFKTLYEVYCIEEKRMYVCNKRKNIPFIVVGDNVGFRPSPDEGVIEEVEPRKNFLPKPAVANVDHVYLVVSLIEPQYSFYQIDSFIAFFSFLDVPITLILNKSDIASARDKERVHFYHDIGYDILTISALDLEEGRQEIHEDMKGKTIVLSGMSGVGKSTFVRNVFPEFQPKVRAVSGKLKKGRQTTKQVALYPILENAFLADSPGFSIVDVSNIPDMELQEMFPEFMLHHGNCRFGNCLHLNEPGCEIKVHLEKGTIQQSRYDSYQSLHRYISKKKKW